MAGRPARLRGGLVLLVLFFFATGCARGCTGRRPPIHPVPDMDDQPKYQAQAASDFFYDGRTMRVPPAGTVARGSLAGGAAFDTGKLPDGSFVPAGPLTTDEKAAERGRERFGIYCTPCHDPRGTGLGILHQRGGVPTTSLHIERIRSAPDGQIFDTITNGVGLMPGYRWPIPPGDRWAIIAYVRKLQETMPVEAAPAAAAPAAGAPAAPAAAPGGGPTGGAP